MNDLLIVSNRGPFSFSEDFLNKAESYLKGGTRPAPPGFAEGGLVQAMSGLLKSSEWNITWIGASMADRDIDVARGHYTQLFKRMNKDGLAPEHFPHIDIDPENRMHLKYKEYDFYMRFVFFDTEHMHSYYSKFANGFLWPLLHLTRPPLFYKKTKAFPRPHFEKNDFVQYTSSGVTFANAIVDELRKNRRFWTKGDHVVVWNQDYHLMRIAEVYKALLLEERIPKEDRSRICVGQFLHTPFFDIHEIQGLIREDKRNRVKAQIYDPFGETIESVLQKLTWGLLSNDFIGFHTKEYCDNYLEALEEWFPVTIRIGGQFYEIVHQDRFTTIGAFPIGIDVDKILPELSEKKILKYTFGGEDLREKITHDRQEGKYIFGGLDRCDYTKGLFERLSIFHRALNALKDLGKEARLYQITAPTRSENPDYQHLHSLLEKEVLKVNRKTESNSIVHIDQGIRAPQNYRFMKELDVMFVTPLEDGMNLVAFEYILSQKYRNPKERGMLVLGTSGASRVLKEKGFDQDDGIIYINPLKVKDAGEKTARALLNQQRLSERVIEYVEKEHRVSNWAQKNIEAILNCKKGI